MRISSSLVFQTGLNTINLQQGDLLHLFQQIGTGQRMVTPADDPLAASQSINLAQSQAQNTRYGDNRAVAQRNLSTEEEALNSLTLLLQDSLTRLVEAANGTLSDADRGTLAGVFEKALESALAIANTTDGNGQYLFSGSKGDTAAYHTSTFAYQGDALQRDIQADETRRIAGGDIGSDIFERAQQGTRAYVSSADSTNAGTLIVGKPAVSDNTGGNSAANYSFRVEFIDETSYDVWVTDTVTGRPVPDPGDPLPVPLPPSQAAVPFAPGQTVLDLGYGTTLDISGGAPEAGDGFDIKPLQHETGLNLFQTFQDVIDVLGAPTDGDPVANANFYNVINSVLQRMHSQYDNVLTVRASIGARMNELSALDGTGAQRNLGFAKALSDLEDLDYYEASTQLNLRKMALEAAGLAFQTIQGLSLFTRGS